MIEQFLSGDIWVTFKAGVPTVGGEMRKGRIRESDDAGLLLTLEGYNPPIFVPWGSIAFIERATAPDPGGKPDGD